MSKHALVRLTLNDYDSVSDAMDEIKTTLVEDVTPINFDLPFGGINTAVRLTRPQLTATLGYLSQGCDRGHIHNVAIQFDGDVLWTTQLGMECVERLLRTRPTQVTVNRLAQVFYDASEIAMPMTDKPKVVAGLQAVFTAIEEGTP